MILDEAIKHCEEKAKQEGCNGNYSCADEHQQLANWLVELKQKKEFENEPLFDIQDIAYYSCSATSDNDRIRNGLIKVMKYLNAQADFYSQLKAER